MATPQSDSTCRGQNHTPGERRQRDFPGDSICRSHRAQIRRSSIPFHHRNEMCAYRRAKLGKGSARSRNVTSPNVNPNRRSIMPNPVVSRDEWLKARVALLADEKELTRRSDALAERRQDLPWVRIDKAYRFDTDKGEASLAELFQGRSQLIVYHFMFGPDFKAGCP